MGISCCLNTLYHSDEKPSGPDYLFVLSLDIALFNSSSVISADNFALQVSLTEGSFNGMRKESIFNRIYSLCLSIEIL